MRYTLYSHELNRELTELESLQIGLSLRPDGRIIQHVFDEISSDGDYTQDVSDKYGVAVIDDSNLPDDHWMVDTEDEVEIERSGDDTRKV